MFDLHIWLEMKTQKKPIVAITAYDYQMTRAIDQAGVDMILVGDSLGMVVLGLENTTNVRLKDVCHHVKAVARAQPGIPIVADMPFLSYGIQVPDTVYNAKKLIAAGAQAVKVEGGGRLSAHIAALVENGIPVVGHLGLTPQSILRLGKYHVAGTTLDEAERLIRDARALDSLGVSALVLECVPEKLAMEITGMVRSPTIGIGAGRHTDGQILVLNDMLGISEPSLPQPKFVHRFADLYGQVVEGVRKYARAVRNREFPAATHVYQPVEKKNVRMKRDKMAIARSLDELGDLLRIRGSGSPVGFVPTMGALHAGHTKLVERARAECKTVVASIYVNPTQFGPKEDYKSYPRDLEGDSDKLSEAGCDILFFPDDRLMYPAGEATRVTVSGSLTEGLCGKSRPGHFAGVATVVLKLLNQVRPDRLYLGQKDAQQVRVIKRMVKDLFLDVEVIDCPTVREADGLAMSSRNAYLSKTERKSAPGLYKALTEARRKIELGERDPKSIEAFLASRISRIEGATLDYAVAVDGTSLKELDRLEGEVLMALAVRFGKARLIDNISVTVPVK